MAYSSRWKRGITVRGRLQGRICTVSSPCREMYLCAGAEADLYSVEEEAAQDRPAASIVRGTTRYSVDLKKR